MLHLRMVKENGNIFEYQITAIKSALCSSLLAQLPALTVTP